MAGAFVEVERYRGRGAMHRGQRIPANVAAAPAERNRFAGRKANPMAASGDRCAGAEIPAQALRQRPRGVEARYRFFPPPVDRDEDF